MPGMRPHRTKQKRETRPRQQRRQVDGRQILPRDHAGRGGEQTGQAREMPRQPSAGHWRDTVRIVQDRARPHPEQPGEPGQCLGGALARRDHGDVVLRQDAGQAAARPNERQVQAQPCRLGDEVEWGIDHQIAGGRQGEQPRPGCRTPQAENLLHLQRLPLVDRGLVGREIQRIRPGPIHQPGGALGGATWLRADQVQHVAEIVAVVEQAGQPGDAVDERHSLLPKVKTKGTVQHDARSHTMAHSATGCLNRA